MLGVDRPISRRSRLDGKHARLGGDIGFNCLCRCLLPRVSFYSGDPEQRQQDDAEKVHQEMDDDRSYQAFSPQVDEAEPNAD